MPAAFTGGNYLAKFLAGDNGKAALDDKTRHDKALEAYQSAMAKYLRERTQILDWTTPTKKSKSTPTKTSRTPIMLSSCTTKTTPTRDLLCQRSRISRTCISPVSCRNRASFFLSAVARSRLVTRLFVFFELLLQFINGF